MLRLSVGLVFALGFSQVQGAHASQASHEQVSGVSPSTALRYLKNGNQRFLKGHLRKDGQSLADRAQLAEKGQRPHSIVFSCSDSRVPPEVIFDQKLGELFVVRSAGQSTDFSEIASIEYAVAHLGPQLILVMGHESCGAVKAALDTPKDKSAGSPALDQLVGNIRPRLEGLSSVVPKDKALYVEGSQNAKRAAQELMDRSELIRNAVSSGKLQIETAIYKLQTGEVVFLGGI